MMTRFPISITNSLEMSFKLAALATLACWSREFLGAFRGFAVLPPPDKSDLPPEGP